LLELSIKFANVTFGLSEGFENVIVGRVGIIEDIESIVGSAGCIPLGNEGGFPIILGIEGIVGEGDFSPFGIKGKDLSLELLGNATRRRTGNLLGGDKAYRNEQHKRKEELHLVCRHLKKNLQAVWLFVNVAVD